MSVEPLFYFCFLSLSVSFFPQLDVANSELGMTCCRRDTYGVYAEPADPEEVSGIYFRSVDSLFLLGILAFGV